MRREGIRPDWRAANDEFAVTHKVDVK